MIQDVYIVQEISDVDPSVAWQVLVIDPDGGTIVIWA